MSVGVKAGLNKRKVYKGVPLTQWFLENDIPFPVGWYDNGSGSNDKMYTKNGGSYSSIMRELSTLTLDEIKALKMFWMLIDFDTEWVKESFHNGLLSDVFLASIPRPSMTALNALRQIELSLDDSAERKEWADRTEGKTVSREVQLSTEVNPDNSVERLREEILKQFDALED